MATLDELGGQAAFVVRDWKREAADRVYADKALGAIKMECAILNQDMGGVSS